MADLNVEITRTNRKVHFEGGSDANPERRIPLDLAPPLGDGNGFAGLELLLMSFAGCVSTTVVFLLGRMGKKVGAYQASAQGVRREQPLSLAKIHLHLQLPLDSRWWRAGLSICEKFHWLRAIFLKNFLFSAE